MASTPIANLRGPKGDPGAPSTTPGPQGLPGVNAVPTDAAVATYMGTPGTQTEEQLNANLEAAVTTPAGPVRQALDSLYGDPSVITDAVQEWWIYPVATQLTEPYPRAVFGGISSATGTGGADILVCEFDYATSSTIRHKVGEVAIDDDHNAPAVWIEPGHRPLVIWSNHLEDNYWRIRVGSRSGDIREWGPQYDINLGVGVSYAQIHRIPSLSTASDDVFWVFYRDGVTSWGMATLTVNIATGSLTYSDNRRIIRTDSQSYISSVPAYDGKTIRIAFGHNPQADTHPIWYLELNTETGAFSQLSGAVLTANYKTATDLPIAVAQLTPVVADPGPTKSRRLFYTRSGPQPPAIAYADWDKATPDLAVYKQLRQQQGDSWNGLRAPIGANVETPYNARLDLDSNFTYETAFKATDAPATTLYFGYRWNASVASEQIWRAGLAADRKVTFNWRTAANAVRTNTTTAAVPGAWTDDLGLRLVFDWDGPSGVNASVAIYYSLNPLAGSPTWTLLETVTIGAAAKMLTGARGLAIGYTSVSSAVLRDVYYARLKDGAGAVVAEAPFSTLWARGASTHTDVAGNVWTLSGSGAVGRTSSAWVTDEFGVSGPRFGYSAESNYIASMGSYPEPAYDDTVTLARRNASDTESTVEEWRRDPATGVYSGRVLMRSATKLVRPMQPKGGGPTSLVTEFTRYDAFTDYQGNTRRVPR